MHEPSNSPEFGPLDREASQESIGTFLSASMAVLHSSPTVYRNLHGGMTEAFALRSQPQTKLFLEYYPFTSGEYSIHDIMTNEPLPNAVCQLLICHDEYKDSNDQFRIHTYVEEMIVRHTSEGLSIGRRVYGKERPDYNRLLEVTDDHYEAYMYNFSERERTQIERQQQMYADEERLGLNRVTEAELSAMIELLWSDLEPATENAE